MFLLAQTLPQQYFVDYGTETIYLRSIRIWNHPIPIPPELAMKLKKERQNLFGTMFSPEYCYDWMMAKITSIDAQNLLYGLKNFSLNETQRYNLVKAFLKGGPYPRTPENVAKELSDAFDYGRHPDTLSHDHHIEIIKEIATTSREAAQQIEIFHLYSDDPALTFELVKIFIQHGLGGYNDLDALASGMMRINIDTSWVPMLSIERRFEVARIAAAKDPGPLQEKYIEYLGLTPEMNAELLQILRRQPVTNPIEIASKFLIPSLEEVDGSCSKSF